MLSVAACGPLRDEDWEIIPISPVQMVELLKVTPSRVRYLQTTEPPLLLHECPERLRPIVGHAVTIRMRRSEIL